MKHYIAFIPTPVPAWCVKDLLSSLGGSYNVDVDDAGGLCIWIEEY